MRLRKKDLFIYKDWITILPTIEIRTDDPRYFQKTVTIAFSWLIFHARLFFIEKDKAAGSGANYEDKSN